MLGEQPKSKSYSLVNHKSKTGNTLDLEKETQIWTSASKGIIQSRSVFMAGLRQCFDPNPMEENVVWSNIIILITFHKIFLLSCTFNLESSNLSLMITVCLRGYDCWICYLWKTIIIVIGAWNFFSLQGHHLDSIIALFASECLLPTCK